VLKNPSFRIRAPRQHFAVRGGAARTPLVYRLLVSGCCEAVPKQDMGHGDLNLLKNVTNMGILTMRKMDETWGFGFINYETCGCNMM